MRLLCEPKFCVMLVNFKRSMALLSFISVVLVIKILPVQETFEVPKTPVNIFVLFRRTMQSRHGRGHFLACHGCYGSQRRERFPSGIHDGGVQHGHEYRGVYRGHGCGCAFPLQVKKINNGSFWQVQVNRQTSGCVVIHGV